tara:strand:+ start:6267 stop:6722 length:456 start_codon:yes stop_codon:yes gene_type:complete
MNIINRSIKALILLFVMSSTSVFAADQVYTGYFSNKAVSGYDVIAFFDQQKPVEGSSKYQLEYKGADWYFSSQQNLDKFTANPEKYAPQYGGYCAWAITNSDTAPGNPPFWTVHNDKLYLNYDQKVQNTWLADIDTFIEKADVIWAKMEKK